MPDESICRGCGGPKDGTHERGCPLYVHEAPPLQVMDDPDTYRDISGGALVHYVDKAMYEAEPVDQTALEKPKVYLLSATPDPLGSLAAACMIYEGKVVRDLAEVTDEQRRFYFEDIWNTTLQAPLEDIDFHFMVEGLTRASWDQMTRQRTANFGGESLRFSVKLPLTTVVRAGPTVNTKYRTSIHDNTVQAIEEGYTALIADGVPAEDARGLLPLNVLVRGHWKTNLRNLTTEIGKRMCTQAQWEWRMILLSMRQAIHNYKGPVTDFDVFANELDYGNHWQFEAIAAAQNLWAPVCFHTGRCMFRAKADRGCTIRERVEVGLFDEIKPEEWLLDPTAAWVK
jgi:flavin-dependent thymidylate synthase